MRQNVKFALIFSPESDIIKEISVNNIIGNVQELSVSQKRGVKIMNKKKLGYIRIAAITMSLMLGTLTLCNLLTVMTHGIEIEIPDENQFSWAIDPVEMKILIITDFTVKNHGAYDIENIDIRARIITDQGKELLSFEEKGLTVSSGSNRNFDILLEISLNDIDLENWLSLLYRNTSMSLVIDIDAEYMFGLIHVTVDEILDRNWIAPLSDYSPENDIVPWILGAFGYYSMDIGQEIWDIQRTAVEYLMEIDEFYYLSEDGYEIFVTGQNSSDGFRELDCAITFPVDTLSGDIQLGYNMTFGIVNEQVEINIQEVKIAYVSH